MGTDVVLVLVALFLVLLNGFFVAAEFSIVKLRRTRAQSIARKSGWRGRMLLRVHENLDAYLSACQLGITLASLGLGWIGEPAFADLLRPVLTAVGVERESVVRAISFSAAFLVISYLHIVVGELAPKSMAIRMSETVGSWTAAPLYGFYWAMYPLIWVLNHSSNWLLRRLGLDMASADHDGGYSAEELKLILRSSRADVGFTRRELGVLAQALDFRTLHVSDLMRPFNEVVALSAADSVDESIDRMLRHRFSRYPYLDADGNVLGVIHLKDVFLVLQQAGPLASLDGLCRAVEVVPPDYSAIDLFRRFQEGSPHFAVVSWASGGPLGFVTMDNLLGALVGEIRDEFRRAENDWVRLDDGSLLGRGSLPIFTLERALGIDVGETEAGSVGGLVLQRLEDLPREGQRIEFDGFAVVVVNMEGPRIAMVRVHPKQAAGGA